MDVVAAPPGPSPYRGELGLTPALARLHDADRLLDSARRSFTIGRREASLEQLAVRGWLWSLAPAMGMHARLERTEGPPAAGRYYQEALDAVAAAAELLPGHPLTTELRGAVQEARALAVRVGVPLFQEIVSALHAALRDELGETCQPELPDWSKSDAVDEDVRAQAGLGWGVGHVLAALLIVATLVGVWIVLG